MSLWNRFWLDFWLDFWLGIWLGMVAVAALALVGCSNPPVQPSRAVREVVGIAPVCTHWAAEVGMGRKYDIVSHAWNCDRGPRCPYYGMGGR